MTKKLLKEYRKKEILYEALSDIIGEEEKENLLQAFLENSISEDEELKEIEFFEKQSETKHTRSRKRKYNYKDHIKFLRLKGSKMFNYKGCQTSKENKQGRITKRITNQKFDIDSENYSLCRHFNNKLQRIYPV